MGYCLHGLMCSILSDRLTCSTGYCLHGLTCTMGYCLTLTCSMGYCLTWVDVYMGYCLAWVDVYYGLLSGMG